MNDTQPYDAFADIKLDKFKQTKPSAQKKSATHMSKTKIKEVAQKNNFQSRQSNPIKEKTIIKTVSLFKTEEEIIQKSLNDFEKSKFGSEFKPSTSDIIRSALHIFSEQSPSARSEKIKQVRGRGRS